ncbi:MAG: ferritin family protein [Bacteroidales bacterium]|nr:ferritin family protein [Lentimicrobiaceae bacterium]MDD5695062.1 ferritin family protein [Bacteroidales bacterium]
MKSFTTADDILDFAIANEQEAVDFYASLAMEARNEEMSQVFTQFAHEEMGHKSKLLHIKTTGQYTVKNEKVMDLKLADYLVDIQPHSGMTYAEVLILAMKREKNAFRLYLDLSAKAPTPGLKDLFLSLAQEESRHKLRFELEYDEFVLKEF